MPPRKKSAKAKKQSQQPRSRWWRLCWALPILFLVYLGYLNHLINQRFEGDTWALPSRVYSRALEIYPGLQLSGHALRYELDLSGYLEVAGQPGPGQYRWKDSSLDVHIRSFEFSEGIQPARALTLKFDDGRVGDIIDIESGKQLALHLLPPVIIGSYYPDSGEDRWLLDEAEIPTLLINTLVAVEDRKFYNHWGVDPRAIARAFIANLQAGKTVQGGSTLTQQLAKNMFLTPEKSLLRKINEAFMALILEFRFSKQAIITAYVNEVFLLQQNRIAIHGFARASRMLFRRSIDQLAVEHIATLVGMVQGPSRYNPFSNPETALKRRNLVLSIMRDQGLIDSEQHDRAAAAPLGVVSGLPGVNPFPAYLDLVKRQLQSGYTGKELAQRGLRVFTAFDPQVQRNLERGLKDGLERFDQPELQAAAVITDYLSGDILALVSDRVSDYPGYNRALMAQRPIGSLVKPMLLYGLLQSGLTLASPVTDQPISIQQSNGDIWEPRNFDRELHGEMTLYRAFTKSYNLPFVHLGVDGGLEALANNLSAIHLLKHDVVYPSMLLGTSAMSAFEVSQMFQVIANNGYFTPLTTLRSVTDRRHQNLDRVPLESHKLFDQQSMIQVQRAMIGAAEEGTASYLTQRFPGITLAGKTGTTNDARDSWFAGFSQRLLGVVWLGRDDNQPIRLSGSSGALRVWSDVMQAQRFESFALSRDDSLAWRDVSPIDGGIARKSCTNSVLLPFPQDRVPSRRSRCP